MSNHAFDTSKWQSMTLFAQMGNIGSEVGRTSKAFKASDKESFDGALRRAYDLFDATTNGLIKADSPRVREVLLARDQFSQQYFSDNPKVDDGLEAYFMQFAIADRLSR